MIPRGFTFSAVNAGVKSPEATRLDMGLIFCDREAVVSGVFTRNKVKAAPVLIDMDLMSRGIIRGILANAGNANACTGETGLRDAQCLMEETSKNLNISQDLIAPISTGVIGVKLPVDRMLKRIPDLVAGLNSDPEPFARSIMTTDTCLKLVTRKVGKATILGMAKGAGMIAPDMATTLAVVLTDAIVSRQELDNIIKKAIDTTFNAITIDGDSSTNDTLLALSSGYIDENIDEIEKGISDVILELALLIVKDGEGATKFVTVNVKGADSDQDAKRAAMAVSNSLLVKTALFGADPNWGRIVAAVGYSGIRLDPDCIDILISGYRVVSSGQESPGFDEDTLHGLFKEKDIRIDISLGQGPGSFTAYTTDLSYEYVKINSEYRT
ncbi:bifunctional glutamate N-acetyltransferase/amino-acid acetyltransferase ArgJ [archaeon]|nr:bifunctional glutamate N-acetyltransferase/amino-acid acetyltransferase ArgJ [archaeon]